MPELFYLLASPPCRSVLLLAKALKLELTLKDVDLAKGEHQTPAFLKLNPQHAVPTLHDNGFALGESRAILAYLAEQYGKDDSLYPKDPKKRAVVDQRLYFDMGSLYQFFLNYYLYPGMNKIPQEKVYLEKLQDAFSVLNTILNSSPYVAGNEITIADYSILVTVSTIVEAAGFDASKYPQVVKWYQKVQKLVPGYKEINEEGNKQLKGWLQGLLKQ